MVAFQLRVRAKTGWFAIRIMCQSGTTCLSVDCCFSERTKIVGPVQSGYHHHFINMQLVFPRAGLKPIGPIASNWAQHWSYLTMILLKNFSFTFKQQSFTHSYKHDYKSAYWILLSLWSIINSINKLKGLQLIHIILKPAVVLE